MESREGVGWRKMVKPVMFKFAQLSGKMKTGKTVLYKL